MSPESHAAPKASIGSSVSQGLVGLWLVLFCYVGTFYIVICSVAAYQVQDRAATLVGEDGTSAAVLIDRAERIRRARDASRGRQELLDRRYGYWDQLDELVERAGVSSSNLLNPSHYEAVSAEVVEGLNALGDSAAAVEFPALLDLFQEEVPEARLEELARIEQEAALNQGDSLFLEREDANEVVNDLVVEIESLWVFRRFVRAPESVLVFLLTIAMGALGSTIHITRAYLARESHRVTWWVVRPLLGTVTAVAIYILAKAGQLALNPGAAAGAMDPWFISFLAIISGLMSEHAVNRISDAGKSFFETTSHDRPDRWGLNLSQKMAESGIDTAPLAAALGVPASRLDSWANSAEAVPAHAQDVIAAWLRLPVRDVFSDMEPSPTVE